MHRGRVLAHGHNVSVCPSTPRTAQLGHWLGLGGGVQPQAVVLCGAQGCADAAMVRAPRGAAPGTGGGCPCGRGMGSGWCRALCGWDGLCARRVCVQRAPKQRAVNMGAEWRRGREVWGSQTCSHTPWAPGPCHGTRQGTGCFLWGPEMGKCPVLVSCLDPKPGTGCQALRDGMAHPSAGPGTSLPHGSAGRCWGQVPSPLPPASPQAGPITGC